MSEDLERVERKQHEQEILARSTGGMPVLLLNICLLYTSRCV